MVVESNKDIREIGNNVATLVSRSSILGRADFQRVKRNQCSCDFSPDIFIPIKNNTFIQVGGLVLCSTCQLDQLTPVLEVVCCRCLRQEEGVNTSGHFSPSRTDANHATESLPYSLLSHFLFPPSSQIN